MRMECPICSEPVVEIERAPLVMRCRNGHLLRWNQSASAIATPTEAPLALIPLLPADIEQVTAVREAARRIATEFGDERVTLLSSWESRPEAKRAAVALIRHESGVRGVGQLLEPGEDPTEWARRLLEEIRKTVTDL